MINTIKKQFQQSALRPAWVYPAIHELKVGVMYTLTISPSKQCTDLALCVRRPGFKTYVSREIIELIPGSGKLYLDVSTKNQRYHYHGYFYFTHWIDIIQFYDNIPKLKDLCTFEIKELNSYEWLPYMRKTKHLFHKFSIKFISGMTPPEDD